MATRAVENLDRLLKRHLGIVDNAPRIKNITQANKEIYGYLEPKKSENLFKGTHLMQGLFSSLVEDDIANGDLIYDRNYKRYGYITQLFNKDYGYEALVYMCNALVTIAHPHETLDDYKQKTIDWTTTVHHTDMRALISIINLIQIEKDVASMQDITKFYCYLQYSATVHRGDRVSDGSNFYLVKNIDDISFDGALQCLEMTVVPNA